MSYIYKYTIPNIKFLNLLHNYIAIIPTLPTNFSLVSEDQISVIFDEQLSNNQIDLLTTSINNYSPEQYYNVVDSTQPISISQNSTNNTDYTSIATYIWIIDEAIKNIDFFLGNVVVVSNLVGPQDGIVVNNASYKIRLYNATNNTIIFESDSLTNTNLQILTFSNIKNVPSINSVLELQAKTLVSNYQINTSAAHFTFFMSIK